MNTITQIFLYLAAGYLSFVIAYLGLLSISGLLARKERAQNEYRGNYFKKIAVLIPAYKEDDVIVDTARMISQNQYPSYDIYIIADKFKQETLESLKSLKVNVIEVSFEKSTKTRSLNRAFEVIAGKYDICLICDADNVFRRKYLFKINDAFNAGFKVVQTQRVAKNLNTPFAVLDACSEAINNHIFRKGANSLGISSALIGSGMAFEFDYLREKLRTIDVVSGFDKALQLEICKEGIKVKYLEDALIFDEKIDNQHSFGEQRKRWIFSQVNFLKKNFRGAFNELFKGNFSYFHLAVLSSLILPRALYLVIFPLVLTVSYVHEKSLFVFFLVLFFLYLAILFLSVPKKLKNRQLFLSLISLPNVLFVMIRSTLSMQSAKDQFIHTDHDKTAITNPLFYSENE